MIVENGGHISSDADGGGGTAGEVALTAGSLTVNAGSDTAGYTYIASNSVRDGRGRVTPVRSSSRRPAMLRSRVADTSALRRMGSRSRPGDVTVTARNLLLYDGAISSDTRTPAGDAGAVRIKTDSLLVDDGEISSDSYLGAGNAGSIVLDVQGPITIDDTGTVQTVMYGGSGDAGSIPDYGNGPVYQ